MGCGASIPAPLATAIVEPSPATKTANGAGHAVGMKVAANLPPSGKDSPFAFASMKPTTPPLDRASMARPKTSIVSRLLPDDEAIARLQALKTSHPNNLAAKHFSKEYYESLGRADQNALLRCLRVGTYHPAAPGPGCYAARCADYDKLKKFFAPLVADFHGVPEGCGQPSNWTPATDLNFSEIGLQPSLTRIGVGRNFAAFPLPAAINRAQRLELEDLMAQACGELCQQDMPDGMPFGGRYYSLTPGRHDVMREQDYLGLVKQGVMFKDMNKDTHLNTAGISSEWPYGRGTYISKCRRIFIWCNEQDHLRVCIFFPAAKSLSEPLALLNATLMALEGILGKDAFKRSEEFGFVTSCPSIIGSGMRAAVTLKVPQLVAGAAGDMDKVTELATPHGLLTRAGNIITPLPLFDRASPSGPRSALASLPSTEVKGPWDGATDLPMDSNTTPTASARHAATPNRKKPNTALLGSTSMQQRVRVTPDGPQNPFVEVTTTCTFGISEAELVQRLYGGVKAVMVEENALQAVIDEAEQKVMEARRAAMEQMRAEQEAARKAAAAAAAAAAGQDGEEAAAGEGGEEEEEGEEEQEEEEEAEGAEAGGGEAEEGANAAPAPAPVLEEEVSEAAAAADAEAPAAPAKAEITSDAQLTL